MRVKLTCPNDTCGFHALPPEIPPRSYINKHGFEKNNLSKNKIQRYRCRICLTTFINRTIAPKPDFAFDEKDKEIFHWATHGATINDIAQAPSVSLDRKTVLKRIIKLSEKAEELQNIYLKSLTLKDPAFQIDELETYENTILLPLSICAVMEAKTRIIIGLSIAEMGLYLEADQVEGLYQHDDAMMMGS